MTRMGCGVAWVAVEDWVESVGQVHVRSVWVLRHRVERHFLCVVRIKLHLLLWLVMRLLVAMLLIVHRALQLLVWIHLLLTVLLTITSSWRLSYSHRFGSNRAEQACCVLDIFVLIWIPLRLVYCRAWKVCKCLLQKVIQIVLLVRKRFVILRLKHLLCLLVRNLNSCTGRLDRQLRMVQSLWLVKCSLKINAKIRRL